MEAKTIDGVKITLNYASAADAPVSDQEIEAYLKRAYEKFPHGHLESLTLDIDGDEVGIHYGFNDAKRAEEADRVKHGISCGC